MTAQRAELRARHGRAPPPGHRPLRARDAGRAAAGDTAATVSETIDERDRPSPGMGDRIRATRPAIRKHMNVLVEGERAGLDTPLASAGRFMC